MGLTDDFVHGGKARLGTLVPPPTLLTLPQLGCVHILTSTTGLLLQYFVKKDVFICKKYKKIVLGRWCPNQGSFLTVFGCSSENSCWRSVTSRCSGSVYGVEVMSLSSDG